MKKIQYIVEFIFLKVFAFLINIFPWKYNRLQAQVFKPLLYIIGNYKRITEENIKESNLNFKKRGYTLKSFMNEVFLQNIQTYIEMIKLMKMNEEKIKKHLQFENKEVLKDLYENHRKDGIVFVLAHIGNWEILGQAVAYDYKLAAIARRQNNPFTEKIISNMRKKSGLKIVYREGAVAFKVLKLLKKGYGVGFLNDQDGGISGVTTEFMGRKCSTPQGPVAIALKTNSIICFTYTLRDKNGDIKAFFEKPFYPEKKFKSREKNIKYNLQKIIDIQERIIHKHPTQWNWLANRWRTER
ncbi:MAG: lysophospholipid acyltransferase family protein [Candidatus Mcinerneyibacterium aminivorans]|uniref:Lysophospholipid acyltransferase family protein n=1 Tax=Candidatus Mcinerneyibacterium aminivorans TaxID=2703815 RepID=A0A5D0MK19_9BACT|nr:MAG: lysophospholipid acyltransferase family protein [Candidatus Mcinerneyibacterium aminivorans]